MSDITERWKGPIAPPDAASLGDLYAIGQLVKVYALGVDTRDYPLMRSVFADDAFCEGSVWSDVVDVYLPKMLEGTAPYVATQHNIINQHIALDGDTAVMWSFGIAHHVEPTENGRPDMVVGVLYRDTCQRYPEGWLIKHRNAKLTYTSGKFPNPQALSTGMVDLASEA